MNTEVWKPVVGYEGMYEVSDRGRVRSLHGNVNFPGRSGRIRVPHEQANGYLTVSLWNPGGSPKVRRATIHKLVAAAFIGERPRGCEVNHRNGNKRDNRAENLEYATRTQNVRHARDVLRVDGWARGERHCRAKLSSEQVADIRAAAGTIREIAARFGVHNSTVCTIRNGQSRKRG
jgi:hypothetical protein